MKSFAIGLFFNDEFDKYVRDLWQSCADKGLSTFMTDIYGLEPHIALAVYNNISEKDILDRFNEYKQIKENSKSLYFDAVSMFKATNVVFLQPNTTKELNNYMLNLHTFFSSFEEKCSPFYTEERWFPHCTIGKSNSTEEGKQLLNFVIDKFEPQIATVTKIGLVELIYKDNEYVGCKTIDCKVFD